MTTKFRAVGWRADVGETIGEWDNPIELALAMWELGLQRPEFDSLAIQEIPVSDEFYTMGQPTAWVHYLMNHYSCSEELAVLALQLNGQSCVHAGAMLSCEAERASLERKLRDAR